MVTYSFHTNITARLILHEKLASRDINTMMTHKANFSRRISLACSHVCMLVHQRNATESNKLLFSRLYNVKTEMVEPRSISSLSSVIVRVSTEKNCWCLESLSPTVLFRAALTQTLTLDKRVKTEVKRGGRSTFFEKRFFLQKKKIEFSRFWVLVSYD